jgi:hypothetical protein
MWKVGEERRVPDQMGTLIVMKDVLFSKALTPSALPSSTAAATGVCMTRIRGYDGIRISGYESHRGRGMKSRYVGLSAKLNSHAEYERFL